jgi:hypothetical protein
VDHLHVVNDLIGCGGEGVAADRSKVQTNAGISCCDEVNPT